MNKEKIEKSIITVGKVIDLARKISGKIFLLAILYFFALVVIIFLMWEVETVCNMKKFDAFMMYLVFLIFFTSQSNSSHLESLDSISIVL